MAQTTLGIDIGAYSVKAVLVASTLKRQGVQAFREFHLSDRSRPLPDPGELAQIARSIAEDPALKANAVVLGLPGAAILKKWLEFPFDDRKKIDETIGFPFSEMVPVAFQDYVIDHHVVGRDEDGQHRLLAVAIERDVLRPVVDAFRSAGLDPRAVLPGGLAWTAALDLLPGTAEGVSAFVDVGYHATELLVVEDGQPLLYRSVRAGTSRLADAVGRLLERSVPEAQSLVEDVLEIVPEGREAPGDEGRTQRVVREQIDALLGEVGLLLHAHQGQGGKAPDRVLLCGGLARLEGAEDWASLRLGLPVSRVSADLEWGPAVPPGRARCGAQKALALALVPQARGRAVEVNFRKGEFAYQGAYEFLRGRLALLGVFFAIFVALAGVKTWLDRGVLQARYDRMLVDLSDVTKKHLGKAIDDFDTALRQVRKGVGVDLAEVVPDEDMYHVLVRITDVLDRMNDKAPTDLVVAGILPEAAVAPIGDEPPAADLGPSAPGGPPEDLGTDRVFVELYDLQMDRKQVRIRAETNSVDAMEAFLAQLKQVTCLHHVLLDNSDRISFKRHSGWRRFSVTATYECKEKKDAAKERDAAKKKEAVKQTGGELGDPGKDKAKEGPEGEAKPASGGPPSPSVPPAPAPPGASGPGDEPGPGVFPGAQGGDE